MRPPGFVSIAARLFNLRLGAEWFWSRPFPCLRIWSRGFGVWVTPGRLTSAAQSSGCSKQLPQYGGDVAGWRRRFASLSATEPIGTTSQCSHS